MAERAGMFCIDFGNAFTKVAYRADVSEVSRPAKFVLRGMKFEDDQELCYPTAALVDRRGVIPQYRFGVEADLLAADPGWKSVRNWKPDLFTVAQAKPPRIESGVGPLIGSAEFARLVRRYKVTADEVQALRDWHASRDEELEELEGADDTEAKVKDTVELAIAYFAKLRSEVMAQWKHMPASQLARTPVRICIPAFFGDGTQIVNDDIRTRFLYILKEAGWLPDPDRPFVTEPVANVLGILTEGRNALRKAAPPGPDFDWMIQHVPLLEAYQRKQVRYAVIVCDIGSYTTDFACVEFSTQDPKTTLPRIRQRSFPVGVSSLEDRAVGRLTQAKQAWVGSARLHVRMAVFRHLLVTRPNKAYATRDRTVGDIGLAAERRAIADDIDWFGSELKQAFETFCDTNRIEECDEIAITGGGIKIPVLGNRLISDFHLRLGTAFLIRTPSVITTKRARIPMLLEHVRAGSAIGGCSVYFDKAFA